MSGFYLGDNNASTGSIGSGSSDSSAPLPFPEPLPRSDFLVKDFDPSSYLSSLGHRHQTLEDLRADLRARSQLLGQELLDLVNSNYNEFLSLGSSLKGGEEKVEELRVGLLSLRREVDSVRTEVGKKEDQVSSLLQERRKLGAELDLGRRILELDESIAALETSLMLDPIGAEENTSGVPAAERAADGVDSDESDDENDESLSGESHGSAHGAEDEPTRVAIARLRRRVEEYQSIRRMAERIGERHPYVHEQEARFMRVRNTLLLDLRSACQPSSLLLASNSNALLKVISLYRDLDAAHEAVDALRGWRSR